jgi:hypothetical protein
MKILNFFDFIFESYQKIEVPLQFTHEFDHILREIDSPISKDFRTLRLSPFELSLLNISDDNDTVTFTTSVKLSQHFKTEDSKELSRYITPLNNSSAQIYHINRSSIKIGRLIRKIFQNKFSDVEIEKFVNQFKSFVDSKSLKFEIWTDGMIVSGYQSKNYTYEASSSNALINSCMNDELGFIDFYRYIPVKLLVLLNEDGHIFGRALIWKTNRGDFMDRIYCAFESDYYKFIDYAKNNNIIYKAENKSGNQVQYVKDGKEGWFPMKINLNFNVEDYNMDDYTGKAKDFPYMDTFIYGQKNVLTNYEPTDGSFFVLQDTSGEYLEVTPVYDIYGQRIETSDIDHYVFSKTQDGWIYYKNAKWLDSEKDYFSFDYLDNPKNGFKYDDSIKSYVKVSK